MSKSKTTTVEPASPTTDPKASVTSSETTSTPVSPDATDAATPSDAPAKSPNDEPTLSDSAPESEEQTIPEAAQLLATADDDSDRMKAVKAAAEEGWVAFSKREDISGRLVAATFEGYSSLTFLEKLCLEAMVLSIVNNPHADSIAKIMADNNDRRTVRILDNELRKALGYAEVFHA